MAKKYKLFSATGVYQRDLEVVADTFTQAINKLDELELYYVGKDPDYGDRIIFTDELNLTHELVIMEINAERKNALIKSCYCVDAFVETKGDYVDDRRFRDASALSAMEGILSSSRFEVGRAEVTKRSNFSIYHTSPAERMKEFLESFECEFKTRYILGDKGIVSRYIDLGDTLGNDSARRFEYSKDLLEVTRKYDPDIIYTALYGYGKGEGEGQRRINFADINGGKKYVEAPEAIEHFGRPTNDGTRQHSYGTVVFENCEDRAELKRLTEKALKDQLSPKVSYSAKVVDLKAYGYDFEGVSVGDAVSVIDSSFDPPLRIRARVVKKVSSLCAPHETELELGSYTDKLSESLEEQKKAIGTINSRSASWDRAAGAFDSTGKLQASYIGGLFDRINDLFLSANTYIKFDEARGLLFFNHKDETQATWAMQLSSAGLRIASSKKANGEWDFKTAATGQGITADVINAGVIRGHNSKYDLNSGELQVRGNVGGEEVETSISPSDPLKVSKTADGSIIGGVRTVYKYDTATGRVNHSLAVMASAVGTSNSEFAEIGMFEDAKWGKRSGLALYDSHVQTLSIESSRTSLSVNHPVSDTSLLDVSSKGIEVFSPAGSYIKLNKDSVSIRTHLLGAGMEIKDGDFMFSDGQGIGVSLERLYKAAIKAEHALENTVEIIRTWNDGGPSEYWTE